VFYCVFSAFNWTYFVVKVNLLVEIVLFRHNLAYEVNKYNELYVFFINRAVGQIYCGTVLTDATGKMRMCGHADLRILERVRVKIVDLG